MFLKAPDIKGTRKALNDTLPNASPKPPNKPTTNQQRECLNTPIHDRPTARPIKNEVFECKEIIWCFIATIMHRYRPSFGNRVIQCNDDPGWGDLKTPDGHSSEEGDQVLLGKISEEDKANILKEFDNYLKDIFPKCLTNEDICPEKMVQIIARFVQQNFLYALGRNANFSEMIKNRCGNCGDKAGIFKLMVYLVKKQYPTIMNGINVDIIVQGAKNPEYLGPGGKLLLVYSQRGMKETTPKGQLEINTFHFLNIITLPSGQIVLLDLSDSSHLSQEYGKIAMQGIHVYPGETPVHKKPDENPFGKNAYILFLPIEDMGVMRILKHENYNKYLFKSGENPMFELLLVGIQSCLFSMCRENEFEEAKKQALEIMQRLIDLMNDTENNQPLHPSTKSFKPLIDKLSSEEKEVLITKLQETIKENSQAFVKPPSTVGETAFIQRDVIDESKSKEIFGFLNKHGFLSDRGEITQLTIESLNTTEYLSEEKNHEVKRHVSEILQNAVIQRLLDFCESIYERSSQEVDIRRIITEVVDRKPLSAKL